MQFKFYEHMKLPIVVVDNFYDENLCKKIWQELCFLNNDSEKLKGPGETASATDPETNEFLKKNKGIFLDAVYRDRSMSSILTANRKIFDKSFIEKLIQYHYIYRYFELSNVDTTLLQYYEDNDYYEYHHDIAIFTVIYWMYNEPKKFIGGNFEFQNGPIIECLNNRLLIFPSPMMHQVTKTQIDPKIKCLNFGRFSITQFVSINME